MKVLELFPKRNHVGVFVELQCPRHTVKSNDVQRRPRQRDLLIIVCWRFINGVLETGSVDKSL